jgi:outer membrane protein assembly factor BamA
MSMMNAEGTELAAEERPALPRVVIASVQFVGTDIQESIRDRIVKEIESPRFYDFPDRSWLADIEEVRVKGELYKSGYFLANIRADARLIDGNQQSSRYALTLYIDEGMKYRLGKIGFVNAEENDNLAFSASELRKRFEMIRGETLNSSKIRNGIEEITKVYGDNGYIDMVVEPEIKNDDNRGVIDVVMKIDQGKKYRVGKVEFLGLDDKSQLLLKPQLKTGDVYDKSLIEELLGRNKALLPSDVSWEDVQLTRNTKEGLVDMLFDFRTCPKTN